MAKNEELRQAENEVKGTGYLKSVKLKKVTKGDRNAITGEIKITDGVGTYKLQLFCNQMTKTGESKTYTYLNTLLNSGESVDSVDNLVKAEGLTKEQALTRAMKIFFTGSSEPFEYFDKDGNFVSQYRIKANYVGAAKEESKVGINFRVETYIEDMIDEKNAEGVTTGRGIIKGITPLYKGNICSLSFVVGEDVKAKVFAQYEVGKTVWLSGDVVTSVTEKDSEEDVEDNDMLFGTAPEKRKSVDYNTELFVLGGSNPYSASREECYAKTDIEDAKLARVEDLEKDKEDYENNKANKSSSSNGSTTTARPTFKFEYK